MHQEQFTQYYYHYDTYFKLHAHIQYVPIFNECASSLKIIEADHQAPLNRGSRVEAVCEWLSSPP